MIDNKDLIQNLIEIGLNESEAKLYLELTFVDSISILELSQKSKLPRTTVYRICEKLVNKRFASWVMKENSTKVRANHPKVLDSLLKEKQDELNSFEKSLESLKLMISTSPLKLYNTEVRYYQGVEGFKQLIWNSLKAKKEIVGYSVYGRKKVVGDKFYEQFTIEFNRRKLRDKVIINDDVLQMVKETLKSVHQQTINDIKYIDKKRFYVAGDVTIYNDIYAVCYWNESDVIGVEIENSELVKMQKSIFEILWEIAKPIKYREK